MQRSFELSVFKPTITQMISNDELISAAERVLKPYTTTDGRLFGDVGAALVSASGKVYTGVCVDTASWGLCAERSAMAAMITDGEYLVAKVVAVWKDPGSGSLHALPPCGVCREFLRQVDARNLETEIVLDRDHTKRLHELLPHHEWPSPLV